MISDKGLVIVLSGFSGAGKGTIMKHLLEAHPNDYNLSISAKTRDIRAGEKDGREYFFKTREEFDKMIENDEVHILGSDAHNLTDRPVNWDKAFKTLADKGMKDKIRIMMRNAEKIT